MSRTDASSPSISDAATPAPAPPKVAKPITRQTKIAEVVDFPLELYAQERARHLDDKPDTGGLPAWLIVVLLALLVGVLVLMVANGPTSIPSLVGLGALMVGLVVALQVRANTTAVLPAERVRELEALDARIKETFDSLKIKCHGCGAAYVETFEQGAKIHGYDADDVVATLNSLGIDLAKVEQADKESATPGR